MEIKKDLSGFWKGLALFLLGMVICFLLIQFTSAFQYNNYALKWQLCTALNMSGVLCDSWWEGVADFSNITKCINTTNFTIIQEQTNLTKVNETINSYLQNYYNKTEVQNISGNQTPVVTKSEFDNWTREFRDNLMNNTASKSDVDFLRSKFEGEETSSADTENIIVWVVIVLVVGAIGYIWFMKNKGKKSFSKTEDDEMNKRLIDILRKKQNPITQTGEQTNA